MVQLILNDGIRRKVWAALYEEKLSKKECVEKFSSVFGKTQMYELFKEFECAYSFERLTKKQKREDAGLCPRGLQAEVLPKLLDVITEDPDRTYMTIKKVFADDQSRHRAFSSADLRAHQHSQVQWGARVVTDCKTPRRERERPV